MLSIPILFVGIVLFSMNSNFIKFGIGLTTLSISSILFLVFYLNQFLSTEGDFQSYKLREARWLDSGFYLNIAYNMWYNSTEVTQEKFLNVDSVQVRIDNGLFGMKTMSNKVIILESKNCKHAEIDTTDLLRSHLAIGHDLAYKRCFSGAIDHYSRCIEIDSNGNDYYYHRGLMYMVLEDYNRALVEFLTSAVIKYNQLDKKTIEIIENVDIQSYTKDLLDKIENKNYDNLEEYIHVICATSDLETYRERIEFCASKITDAKI